MWNSTRTRLFIEAVPGKNWEQSKDPNRGNDYPMEYQATEQNKDTPHELALKKKQKKTVNYYKMKHTQRRQPQIQMHATFYGRKSPE